MKAFIVLSASYKQKTLRFGGVFRTHKLSTNVVIRCSHELLAVEVCASN
jgi:hypothetical protein